MKKIIIITILIIITSCSLIAYKIEKIKDKAEQEYKIELMEKENINSKVDETEEVVETVSYKTVSNSTNDTFSNFKVIKYTMIIVASAFIVTSIYGAVNNR